MPYVITRPCVDCLDGGCVGACPVDCIVQAKPDAGLDLPDQLFIDPMNCISCGCCVPACPAEAIFDDCDVPVDYQEDIALNAVTAEQRGAFRVPDRRSLERRTKADE